MSSLPLLILGLGQTPEEYSELGQVTFLSANWPLYIASSNGCIELFELFFWPIPALAKPVPGRLQTKRAAEQMETARMKTLFDINTSLVTPYD